jgi:hypothetical protein
MVSGYTSSRDTLVQAYRDCSFHFDEMATGFQLILMPDDVTLYEKLL